MTMSSLTVQGRMHGRVSPRTGPFRTLRHGIEGMQDDRPSAVQAVQTQTDFGPSKGGALSRNLFGKLGMQTRPSLSLTGITQAITPAPSLGQPASDVDAYVTLQCLIAFGVHSQHLTFLRALTVRGRADRQPVQSA
jgi:hypothetical protein